MKLEEIRELFTDYLDERLNKIDHNGLTHDAKRSYRDAIRHIRRDMSLPLKPVPLI